MSSKQVSATLIDPIHVQELQDVLTWISGSIINPHADEEDPYYPDETIELKSCTMGDINAIYSKVMRAQMALSDALKQA